MMKKWIKGLFIALSTFILVACGSTINGTYKYEVTISGITQSETITIQDKEIKGKWKSIIGEYDVTGTVDQSNKTMAITQFGVTGHATYTIDNNGDLLITVEGETLRFVKQK